MNQRCVSGSSHSAAIHGVTGGRQEAKSDACDAHLLMASDTKIPHSSSSIEVFLSAAASFSFWMRAT